MEGFKVWQCSYCIREITDMYEMKESDPLPMVPEFFSQYDYDYHLKMRHPIIYANYTGAYAGY